MKKSFLEKKRIGQSHKEKVILEVERAAEFVRTQEQSRVGHFTAE